MATASATAPFWTIRDNIADRPVTVNHSPDWRERIKFPTEKQAEEMRDNLTARLPEAQKNSPHPLFEVRRHSDEIRRAKRKHGAA